MRHKPLPPQPLQPAVLSALLLWLLLVSPPSAFNARAAPQDSQPEEPEEHSGLEPDASAQGSWSHWWSYDGISGPTYWNINKRWRTCSRGREQSPVELRTELLVYDHLLGPFRLAWQTPDAAGAELPVSGLHEPPAKRRKEAQPHGDKHSSIRMRLLNTGRGLELSPVEEEHEQANQLLLSDGPLSYSYRLFRLELHAAESADFKRSSGPTTTSEHLINGRWFDGELQLHFYNHRLASSHTQAAQMAERGTAPANLFAAIAVFIRAGGGEAGPLASPLDPILEQVSKVANKDDRLELRMGRHELESLVPDRQQYITYHGSQNRPPCAEGLQWILVNQALRVDAAKFRLLFQKTSTSQDNVRPTQALNGRLLRTTIDWRALAGPNCSWASNSSASAKSNCSQIPATSAATTTLPAEQMAAGQPATSLEAPEPRAACNMRPNYGYQLSSQA